MSESVIAVVHKSKNSGHRVVCTFDNYKDAGDWIDKQYENWAQYYATSCQMEIVAGKPKKGAQLMTIMYDDIFGEGTLAMRCTIDEDATKTRLLWMLQCKKAVDVPVVYKFKECDL